MKHAHCACPSAYLVKQLGDKLAAHVHTVTVAIPCDTAVDTWVRQLSEQQTLWLHHSAHGHLHTHPIHLPAFNLDLSYCEAIHALLVVVQLWLAQICEAKL